MGRILITVLAVSIVLIDITTVRVVGWLEYLLLILSLILLWAPLKYTYKISFIKNMDKKYIDNVYFKRIIRIIVGKKELAEMERILKT